MKLKKFYKHKVNSSENPVNQDDDNDIVQEYWIVHTWRPLMAITYMIICLFDFVIAPTGTTILITFFHSTVPVWKSLTLENGGVVHMAFGAILGVAAWGRTREAIMNSQVAMTSNGSIMDQTSTVVQDNTYVKPVPQQPPSPPPRQVPQQQETDNSDGELLDNMHPDVDSELPRRTINK